MSKTNILQTMLTLCVVGAFAAFGASCGSSEPDCSSDQAFYQGQCVDTCDSVEDCEQGQSCVGTEEINGKVCVGGDNNPDGGMDGSVDDGGDDDGGNEDDGGNGGDGGQICESLQTCIQNSCASQSGVNLASCIETNCETELNNCPEAAGLSCSGYIDCLNNCPSGDSSCENECQSNLGELGAIRVNAYGTCLNENDCDSASCRMGTCGDEFYACFPDRAPGQATCNEIFRCESVGIGTCESNGTQQAQIDRSELITCADGQGCLDDGENNPLLCLYANCGTTGEDCGIYQGRSCSEVSACINSTQSGTEARTECYMSFSSAQEATEYRSYVSCATANCSDAADFTLCAQDQCGQQRDSCGLNGTSSTCSDMWACATGETSGCDPASPDFAENLFNNYIYEGSAQAQSDFFALNDCQRNSGCTPGDSTCLENECGAEANACGVSFGN